MLDPGLQGRVALVTGANHGIGAATALALAAQGAKVYVAYWRGGAEVNSPAGYDEARLADADAVIAKMEAPAAAGEFDLSDPTNIPRLLDAVENELGAVEILVNNAAYWQADMLAPFNAQTDESWHIAGRNAVTAESIDRHFAVNARAVALLMAEFARRIAERNGNWGRIINLSTGGAAGFPTEVSYGASKAALESYSRAAAVELGSLGITVNIVSPGPTQTGWITPDVAEGFIQRTALRRVGTPEDIADAIVLLASEQARWITGQLIHVHGGFA